MSLSNVISRVVGSVRKRSQGKRHQSRKSSSMILLGIADHELATALHYAAMTGTKAKLKKILSKGISVDYPNSLGQTPLFCACVMANENTANFLLQHGADPNYKDSKGMTPVHVACYTGSIGLLCKMIGEGGDVCLKDNDNQGILEWAAKNEDFKTANEVVAFLQQSKIDNLFTSAPNEGKSCESKISNLDVRPLKEMSVPMKTTQSDISVANYTSTGFPQVHLCARENAGVVSVVPVISETMLMDVDNVKFKCSLDFDIREMLWQTTEVSVKSLRSECEIKERMDVIQSEASFLSKLRHPNVILLLAVCQPPTLDWMMLVFERVYNKNLYHCLHVDNIDLPHDLCLLLAIQICSGMGYVHHQGYIHCVLTSLAVYLSYNLVVKLGNFEFMVDSCQVRKDNVSVLNSHPNLKEMYNWLAPEIIHGNPSSFDSDIYSFSCILWELFTSTVPWSWLTQEHLYETAYTLTDRHPLPMEGIPEEIQTVIDRGLTRKDDILPHFDSIYIYLKGLKGKLNKSYNSISNNSLPMNTSQGHAVGTTVSVQDKLDFGASNLGNQGRSFKSTPAIASTTNDTDDQYKAAYNKNCSEGDLFTIQSPGISQPAIKPASHRHQPNLTTKPQASLAKASTSKNSGMTSMHHHHLSKKETVGKVNSCSVKQLADDYQQIISQHKLRQAILKGSMAPHGGCAGIESPMDNSRWHSLPSTIKEWSKMYSPEDDDSIKTGLSDLGNMSCTTPGVKQTSTPLRRHVGGKNELSGIALVDYFSRQRIPRVNETSCKSDDIQGESQELDNSTKMKAMNMVDEMKMLQSRWKRHFSEDGEEEEEEGAQGGLGITYNSPVIEIHKRRASVVDHMNHTLLQTTGDPGGSTDVECVNLQNELEDGEMENRSLQYHHTDDHDDDENGGDNNYDDDDSLKNFHRRLHKAAVNVNELGDDSDDDVDNDDSDAKDVCLDEEVRVEMEYQHVQTKDSFWDLSASRLHWDKNQDVVDAGFGEAGVMQDGLRQEDTGNDEGNDLCVSGDSREMEVLESNENVEECAAKDATFYITLERMDENTTFTLDANTTEPDSWFPDTAPSQVVSSHREYEDGMDGPADGKMEEMKYVVLSHPQALDPNHNNHLLNAKGLEEFEFSEFYIDDELDTSENLQSVHSNESTPIIGANDKICKIIQADPFSSPCAPGISHSDCLEGGNNTKTTPPTGGWHGSTSHPNILYHSKSAVEDVQITSVVKDRIALFGGRLQDNGRLTRSEQVVVSKTGNASSAVSHDHERQSASESGVGDRESIGTSSSVGCESGAIKKCVGKSVEAGGKTRLIPKIWKEEYQQGKRNESDGVCDHNDGRQGQDHETSCGGGSSGSREEMMDSGMMSKRMSRSLIQSVIRSCKENGNVDAGDIDDDDNKHYGDRGQGNDKNKDEEEMNSVECNERLSKKSEFSLHSQSQSILGRGASCIHDTDSDEWLRERLHSIQEKIRRRRQRDVYTISSEEEEGSDEDKASGMKSKIYTFPRCTYKCTEWRGAKNDDFDGWKFDYDVKIEEVKEYRQKTMSDTSHCSQYTDMPYSDGCSRYKPVSISSSERLSLPQKTMSGRLPYINQSLTNTDRSFAIKRYSLQLDNDPLRNSQDLKQCDLKRGEDHPLGIKSDHRQSPDSGCSNFRMNRALSSDNFPKNQFKMGIANKTSINKLIESQRIHSRSVENMTGSEMKGIAYQHHKQPQRKTFSTSALSKPSEKVKGSATSNVPVPKPRSHGNLRSYGSKSSVRTVMFEDEADGLRQFSPGARDVLTDDFNVVAGSGSSVRSARLGWQPDWRALDKTFNVMDENHQDNGQQGREKDNSTDQRPVSGKSHHGVPGSKVLKKGETNHSCVTVGLGGHCQHKAGTRDGDAAADCSRERLCTIGDNVYTEVHRFYIPKDKWPDGCKTRFHMNVSPSNPHKHRISTTAIHPVTGHTEVLMEKTVETDRLKSHLAVD